MFKKLFIAFVVMTSMTFSMSAFTPAPVSAACSRNTTSVFDIFPHWYKYLDDKLEDNPSGGCTFNDFQWGDIWKVALAIIEMLLRLAGIVAFVYVVIGGFKFVLSRGNPQEAAKARQTIIDALIGMGIALIATVLVSFIGKALTKS